MPASAGFRFCHDQEWLNAFLFPISRECFIGDLARLRPSIDAKPLDPGDLLELTESGEILLHRDASTVARTDARDTARLAYDPTAPVPELAGPNPDAYASAVLDQLAVGVVTA